MRLKQIVNAARKIKAVKEPNPEYFTEDVEELLKNFVEKLQDSSEKHKVTPAKTVSAQRLYDDMTKLLSPYIEKRFGVSIR